MLGKDLTLWRSNVSTRHKKQEVCVEQLKQMERVCKWVPIISIIYSNLLHMFENNNWQWSKVLVVGGHSLWSQILCCQSNICHAWSCRFAMLAMLAECLSQNGAVSQPWPSRPTLNADIARRDKACEYSEYLRCTGKWLNFVDTIVVTKCGYFMTSKSMQKHGKAKNMRSEHMFQKKHKRMLFLQLEHLTTL